MGAVDYITKPVSPPVVRAGAHPPVAGARMDELRETRLQIVQRLGRAAEYKDNETGMHVIRMSHFSQLLALAAGHSPAWAEDLLNAAPMHDVGKIGIPDAVLRKPGPAGRRRVGTPCAATPRSAPRSLASTRPVCCSWPANCLAHHEKWDGSGYPRGLAGEAIPVSARIVAVADVFDALTTRRPYKEPWPGAGRAGPHHSAGRQTLRPCPGGAVRPAGAAVAGDPRPLVGLGPHDDAAPPVWAGCCRPATAGWPGATTMPPPLEGAFGHRHGARPPAARPAGPARLPAPTLVRRAQVSLRAVAWLAGGGACAAAWRAWTTLRCWSWKMRPAATAGRGAVNGIPARWARTTCPYLATTRARCRTCSKNWGLRQPRPGAGSTTNATCAQPAGAPVFEGEWQEGLLFMHGVPGEARWPNTAALPGPRQRSAQAARFAMPV